MAMAVVQNTIGRLEEFKSKVGRSLGTPMRLRDLIRQVRAARTAAEERQVVQKECANIREMFREEDNVWRCRSFAKLLYIHMLGYPAHFGQLECLKLIASSRFTDKRIGYLGAMLLLDERTDIHLLITNSLKNDLNSQSQFIAGLALCALGAICSQEMCRDLAGEVERLLKSSNTYLRKKLVPNLVRILKNLLMSGYSPEHDVTGISDPFLQVKILKLLKLLGKNDYECSETMNDILAQVATNTESSKNVGNAILYETVQTIMDIQSESGLRVLAVNILGRFLLNPDKNIRYVALNTLLGTVIVDNTAVQRHRTTIVDCLKDPDVSIKRRSVELCFALMNASNIRSMSKEIISFMEYVEPEFKAICSSNMYIATERFSPDRRWHFDTMLKVLKVAGNYVPDDVVSSMIQMLSENTEYQGYAALELYRAVKEDQTAAQPLQQVACWCIGEFGDLLVTGRGRISDDQNSSSVDVGESEIVQTFERILISSLSTPTTKQYALTSAAKLSARFSKEQNEALKRLIQVHSTSVNLELQQRSVEFGELFNNKEKLRHDLLERMPVITSKSLHTAVRPMENGDGKLDEETSVVHAPKSSDDLCDLFEIDQTSSITIDQMTTNKKFVQPSAAQNDLLGLLNEVTSTPATTTILPVNGFSAKTHQDNAIVDLFGLLDTSSIGNTNQNNVNSLFSPSSNEISIPMPTLVVFDQAGLKIEFSYALKTGNDNKQLSITLSATNSTPSAMESFVFQAAVTKAFQIHMLPPSSSVIKPLNSEKLTQVMEVHRISPGQAAMETDNLGVPMKYGWRANGKWKPTDIRYLVYWLKRYSRLQETMFIDALRPLTLHPYYGVPCGGMGSGAIGRDFRGSFCKYSLRPGMVEHTVIDVPENQFIVNIRRRNSTVYQKVLGVANSCSKRHPKAWAFDFPAENLDYVGLYPRSWTTFRIPEHQINLCCRQISPIVPHNYKDTCLPVVVFVWTVENYSYEPVDVSLCFTFRNGTGDPRWAKEGPCTSNSEDPASGIDLKHTINRMACTYFLAGNPNSYGNVKVVTTSTFDVTKDGSDVWNSLFESGCQKKRSEENDVVTKELGVALCQSTTIEPFSTQSMDFSLAWYMPEVWFTGKRRKYKRRYTRWFGDASNIAHYALENFHEWEKQIEEWQCGVLHDPNLPDWYKTALFNELYYLTDGGCVWFSYDDQWKLDEKHLTDYTLDLLKNYDRFAYLECDQIENEDRRTACFFYKGDRGYVKTKNRIPHDLGSPAEDPWLRVNAYLSHNTAEWKDLNLKFILTSMRDYFILSNITEKRKFLEHVWPNVKTLIHVGLTEWDVDGDSMIENGGTCDQTYDSWRMHGTSSYCGSLWLGALKCAQNMAQLLGDNNSEKEYSLTLEKARSAFEKKLFQDDYYHFDEGSIDRCAIMADQLCGFWYLCACNIGNDLLPEDHVLSSLKKIYEMNFLKFGDGRLGAANGFMPDGSKDTVSMQAEEMWTGVSYALASLMIDKGLDIQGFSLASGVHGSIFGDLGMQFQSPEAVYERKYFRALGYMRAMAIWAIQWMLEKPKLLKHEAK